MLATLSVLMCHQHLPQLRRYVGAALHIGMPARAVQEAVIQCGIYTGFPAILNALATAREVFAERGVAVPEPEIPDPDHDALLAAGVATMEALHGDRARQGYADAGKPTTATLYEIAVAYGYGDIWSRPDLDRRQRMICAIAAFTALGLAPQVAKFGVSALNLGLTKEEVLEVVTQTGPYSGFPRALNALALLGEP